MTDLHHVLTDAGTAAPEQWREYGQILERFYNPADGDEQRLRDLMQALRLSGDKVKADLATLEEIRSHQWTIDNAGDIEAEAVEATEAYDEANKYEAKMIPEIKDATEEARGRFSAANAARANLRRATERLQRLKGFHPHLFTEAPSPRTDDTDTAA